MKRRILLVDDDVTILLTLKAVLEINGFEVETAASGKEAKARLRNNTYHMVITDMRMESDDAGLAVVRAARKAPYNPAIAMLTAFPTNDADDTHGADEMLVKPVNTRTLLRQLEALLVTHEDTKRKTGLAFEMALRRAMPVVASKAAPRAAARRKTPARPSQTN